MIFIARIGNYFSTFVSRSYQARCEIFYRTAVFCKMKSETRNIP
jgi:hypothetical protein